MLLKLLLRLLTKLLVRLLLPRLLVRLLIVLAGKLVKILFVVVSKRWFVTLGCVVCAPAS